MEDMAEAVLPVWFLKFLLPIYEFKERGKYAVKNCLSSRLIVSTTFIQYNSIYIGLNVRCRLGTNTAYVCLKLLPLVCVYEAPFELCLFNLRTISCESK